MRISHLIIGCDYLFLKKLKSHRRIKPSMTWPAGFLTTVTVAFVLCDTSVSDELCKLAELSLLAEPLVLLDSVTDDVSVGADGGGCSCRCAGPSNETLGTGLGSDTTFWEWFTEMEFDSPFNGSHSSAVEEVVLDFESVVCLSEEDSVSTGLDISCQEAPLSDGSTAATDKELKLLVGWSAFGFRTSRSFNDSITASMNI